MNALNDLVESIHDPEVLIKSGDAGGTEEETGGFSDIDSGIVLRSGGRAGG